MRLSQRTNGLPNVGVSMINIASGAGVNTCIVILVIIRKWKFNISTLIMKRRIRKKMQKYQHRYKLHQYLRYARQWCLALAYKGKMYTLLDDGRIVKENGQL